MTTVADIQRALNARGESLAVDGDMGPKTLAAIMRHLEPTLGELDDVRPTVTPLPWMVEAKRYLGLHEVNNGKVLDKALKLDAASIPWCGAFVALCMGVLPGEVIPANPLWARNWAKFGRDAEGVRLGTVAVFERGTGGHVGFVVGHDKDYLHILGGNQSNKVSVAKIAKSRLLALRLPNTFQHSGGVLPFTTFTGAVSVNEH